MRRWKAVGIPESSNSLRQCLEMDAYILLTYWLGLCHKYPYNCKSEYRTGTQLQEGRTPEQLATFQCGQSTGAAAAAASLCSGHSVSGTGVPDSWWPRGRQPARLLCPCNSPGKNTGVGCHALLQAILSTQGLNRGLSRFFTVWATREANSGASWIDSVFLIYYNHCLLNMWNFSHNGYSLDSYYHDLQDISASPMDTKEIKPVNPRGNQP